MLRFDFDAVDAIYDQLLEIGLRPVVELSFMPRAMARDPEQTVFTYRGIISPPADWVRVARARRRARRPPRRAVRHRRGRRSGRSRCGTRPNLEVFWTGYAARNTCGCTPNRRARSRASTPGCASAGRPPRPASGSRRSPRTRPSDGVPLDFATTHTYGNLPLDARPSLARHGFDGIPIWWTEWGVSPTHFGPIHDGVIGAPFALSGFADVQGRLDALAYWVISDHFEELGRPPRLFHDGFGLLSVGNLRKPRYWAVHLAAHQGDTCWPARVDGDGAGVLVQAWATRHDDGTVDVLVWNGTVNSDLVARRSPPGSARSG